MTTREFYEKMKACGCLDSEILIRVWDEELNEKMTMLKEGMVIVDKDGPTIYG